MSPDRHFRNVPSRLATLIERAGGVGVVSSSSGILAVEINLILSGKASPTLDQVSTLLIACGATEAELFQ